MMRHITPANLLATVAVVIALTGTTIVSVEAAATKRVKATVTGAQVRNNSLTGADVRNDSLSSGDLSRSTQTRLRAQAGAKGPSGDTGPAGNQGAKGGTGAAGPDAARAYSFITAADTTSFVKPKTGALTNPRSGFNSCNGVPTTLPATTAWDDECTGAEAFFPHWAYDCGASPERYCNLGDNVGSAGAGATLLTAGDVGVIGFTGDENGSFVSLMGPGNVIVSASLTLLRRTEGYHARIACQPQVRRSNSSTAYTNLGVPTIVSAADTYQLVHISVTGGTHLSEAGDYDYQVSCRLLDEYDPSSSFGDWVFVSGNATATTTEL
jgi:hypothetical protein